MTLAANIVLPAQPTTGEVVYMPYGGDGLSSPHAAYVVRGFGLTGDASGGALRLEVVLDDRFCSLISYVEARINTVAGGDEDIRLSIRSDFEPDLTVLGLMTSRSQFVTDCNALWVPPAVIYPGERPVTVTADYDNVLNDVYSLDMLIYLFDIRVRTEYPLAPLLQNAKAPFLSLGGT